MQNLSVAWSSSSPPLPPGVDISETTDPTVEQEAALKAAEEAAQANQEEEEEPEESDEDWENTNTTPHCMYDNMNMYTLLH